MLHFGTAHTFIKHLLRSTNFLYVSYAFVFLFVCLFVRPVNNSQMVGALDMGGSSTQLVFHVGTEPGESVNVDDFW